MEHEKPPCKLGFATVAIQSAPKSGAFLILFLPRVIDRHDLDFLAVRADDVHR
jgi:hypothetical protein